MALQLSIPTENFKSAWQNYFGTSSKVSLNEVWRDENDDNFEETGNLPKAYKGKNAHITNLLKQYISSVQKGTLLDIAPIEETKDYIHKYTSIYFDRYLMADGPPDGNPSLIEVNQSGNQYTLKSKLLAGRIRHLFYATEEGQHLYEGFIKTLVNAALNSMLYEATMRFFNTADFYRYVFNNQLSKNTYAELVEESYRTWGLFSKSMDHIHDILNQIKTKMGSRGTPNVILIPKSSLHSLAYRSEERDYSKRGPLAIDKIENGAETMLYIAGLKCMEIQSFDDYKCVNGRTYSPTTSDREIGNYWILTDFCKDYKHFSSNNNFAIQIPCLQNGRGYMSKVSGLDGLHYSFLFDNATGELDHAQHRDTITHIDALKNTLGYQSHDVDLLTISYHSKGWNNDEKYRPIQHIGEMNKTHLTDDLLKKMAICCENHFTSNHNNAISLNELDSFVNLLNKQSVKSGSDIEWWLVAVYHSFDDGFENHHLLDGTNRHHRVPNLPYVGENGLRIKHTDGTLHNVVRVPNVGQQGNNNNVMSQFRVLQDHQLVGDEQILKAVVKPIGMGTATGLAILNDMYHSDKRGYDDNILKTASDLHTKLLNCYDIFKDIFNEHELTAPEFVPLGFKNTLGLPDEYTAWVSNLCLPFQAGIFLSATEYSTDTKIMRYIGLAIDGMSIAQTLSAGQLSNIIYGCNILCEFNRVPTAIIGGNQCTSMYFLMSSIHMVRFRCTSPENESNQYRSFKTANSRYCRTDQTFEYNNIPVALIQAEANETQNMSNYHINAFDRYKTYKTNKDFLRRLFCKSIITHRFTKKNMIAFWNNNIVLPFSFILDRPRQRFEMSDVVVLDAGTPDHPNAKTCYTDVDCAMGDDVIKSQYTLKLTLACGTIIPDAAKLYKINNAICSRYISGGDVNYISSLQEMTQLKTNHRNPKSIFIRAVPYIDQNDINKQPNVRDISGIWNETTQILTNLQSVPTKDCCIKNAAYYEYLWRLTRFPYFEDQNRFADPFDPLSQIKQPNTVVFRGLQYMYNNVSARWEFVLSDKSPFTLRNGTDNTLQCTTNIQTKVPDGFIEI